MKINKENKIRKITLDSFRAVSGKLDLNFETESEVADIVVVYAPNGTGKTSTIEGIEWATTGKISRIDTIIANNNSKNRNPKEGHILKNRYSKKKNGSVTIELENGGLIHRKTKPKLNRNNDYCEGVVENKIDNMECFTKNILSQGTISRFSYEASSGSLFQSLIGNNQNSEDIEVYEKLNEIKNNLDNSNSERNTEISYIKKLIHSEKKELSALEKDFTDNTNFIKSDEYNLFKNNFSLYQDVSIKSVSESIGYLTELLSSFEGLKSKLIEFDIESYRECLKNQYSASKIIKLENDATEKRAELNRLKLRLSKLDSEKEKFDTYLNDRNIENINSKINLYQELNIQIDNYKDEISKAVYVNNLVLDNNAKLDLISLQEDEKKVQVAEGLLELLFGRIGREDITLLKDEQFLKKINDKIEAKSSILNSITRSSFIQNNSENNNVIELRKKSLDLEKTNTKIKELYIEKEKIISFEEKLALIKSYVTEAINDKRLSNCPACGTQYDSMEQLIESVNSFKTDSKNLVDGAIDTLNNQKIEFISEIERLTQEIDKQISERKVLINNDITQLEDRKQHALKLYSLLSDLGVQYVHMDINNVSSKLSKIKEHLRSRISLFSRKKEKYTRWSNRIESYTSEKINKFDNCNLELKSLINSCKKQFGLDIQSLILNSNLHHVYLFKSNELLKLQNDANHSYTLINNDLEGLENNISKFRSNAGFSHDSVMKEILGSSSSKKKTIRANYNHIKNRITSYKTNNNFHFVELITQLEEKFTAYLSNLKSSQKIKNKNESIAKNIELLETKQRELSVGIVQFDNVKRALDETMVYFSKLASDSINNDILNDMFMYIEPHLKYDEISFKVELNGNNKGIYIQAKSNSMDDCNTPIYYLSEAQINILSICIFLADHARELESSINTIVIDDPVQSMDDLNSYALIDLCKIFTRRFKKQIIITTHNRSFFNLFRDKLPEERYSTKYINLSL